MITDFIFKKEFKNIKENIKEILRTIKENIKEILRTIKERIFKNSKEH
jgi:effector-binding domain-containing protein